MAGKKNNKTLWTIVAIVSAIVLVVCGVSIVQRIVQDNEANRENQEMAELAYTITPVPTATPEPTPEMTASPEPATPTPSPTLPPVPQEIDFAALPEQFVLKCNHNSGLGMCICKDKSTLDLRKVRRELLDDGHVVYHAV